jgi:hypothetical protein
MKLKIFLIWCWAGTAGIVQAQKRDEALEHLNHAKDFMSLGKYGLAMQALNPILSPYAGNRYADYANFYYALAAHSDGQLSLAVEKMRQLRRNSPEWDKRDEVDLWLTHLYMESGLTSEAFASAGSIRDRGMAAAARELLIGHLERKEVPELRALLSLYPSETALAEALANRIASLPPRDRDLGLLDNLVSVYQLDREKYLPATLFETQKKEAYQVAVLLPFMLGELKNQGGRVSNPFVLELYQGICLAAEDINAPGKRIQLFAYDTQRNSEATSRLLEQPEMKHMDLILGPLYPEPVQLVSGFAADYRINMINPLSGNPEIISQNPFAFLFMPTPATMARRSAEFVVSQLSRKTGIVLYDPTERDSVMAAHYAETLKENGHEVLYIGRTDNERAAKLIRQLGETYLELELSDYKKPGHSGVPATDSIRIFRIPTGELGQFFLASANGPTIVNTLTALTARTDSIALIGVTEWLQSRVVSLETLEKLRALLIGKMHFPHHSEGVKAFAARYQERYKMLITENALIGYELMRSMNDMLRQGGNLFQYDRSYPGPVRHYLGTGYKPGEERDNQAVPVLMIREGDLVQAQAP